MHAGFRSTTAWCLLCARQQLCARGDPAWIPHSGAISATQRRGSGGRLTVAERSGEGATDGRISWGQWLALKPNAGWRKGCESFRGSGATMAGNMRKFSLASSRATTRSRDHSIASLRSRSRHRLQRFLGSRQILELASPNSIYFLSTKDLSLLLCNFCGQLIPFFSSSTSQHCLSRDTHRASTFRGKRPAESKPLFSQQHSSPDRRS